MDVRLALLPAATTFLISALLGTFILTRQQRSALHWTFLAVLASLMTWSGGIFFRHSVSSRDGLLYALWMVFLGIHFVTPCWFLLASRYTRAQLLEDHPSLKVLVFAPAVLAYLALLTNRFHGLYHNEIDFFSVTVGPRIWAGPVFWMFLTWGYGLTLAGSFMMVAHAWRLRGTREYRRGLAMALAALMPVSASIIHVLGIIPNGIDMTPFGLSAAVVIFYVGVSQSGLLETLPLARRDVIEHLHQGVLISDLSGTVLDLNPAARRILQPVSAGFVGSDDRQSIVALARQEDAPRVTRVMDDLTASGESLRIQFETREGRRMDLSVARVRAGSGEPAGRIAVLRDCTDEHHYARVVRQAQRLESVGVLAAGVAHEVNNPLAFIQANLGLIRQSAEVVERNLDRIPEKDAAQLAELRELAEDSLEGISRISRIVDGLRRFSCLAEGQVSPLQCNEVVEDAIRFARLDRSLQVPIALNAADDLPPLLGSREHLVQVLLNLLVNAKHALQGVPGGRIVVTTRLEDGSVVVSIQDNGPGVPESIRDRIFDPFFTTKDPDEGTGLGLSIAFDIVHEHGGVLEVDSPPDQGACFTLRLPPAAVEDEPDPPEEGV